ncbi:MAG: hypothetical protein JNM27_03300 [Leptospirales bacterium]|nr:hypothetical protein [Leptospirales bacterium]
MLIVDPLWEKPLAPAFVLGYELEQATEDSTLEQMSRTTLPAWLCGVRQQYGGHAVLSDRTVVGVVIPLHANVNPSLESPEPLFETFDWFAQIDKYQRRMEKGIQVKKPPYYSDVLRSLVHTGGEDLSEEALDFLRRIISQHFLIPGFVGGPEAFVRCAAAESVPLLTNWNMAVFDRATDAALPSVHNLDLTDLFRFYNVSYAPLSADALNELSSVARRFSIDAQLEAFFMWRNSD